MGPWRLALLLLPLTQQALGQPAAAAGGNGRPVFLPPPLLWDNAMLSARPALRQTATDFASLTGGLGFGLSPLAVNALLPQPYAGLSWNALAMANEYPDQVRFFGVALDGAGLLRMGLTACAGSRSHLLFLFSPRGLFRLSYRLLPDKACPDTQAAAQQIFSRYVTLGQDLALSLRYQTGHADVVDVTDPTAGPLVPVRWRQGIDR